MTSDSYSVSSAGFEDIDAIARIHQLAFDDFFLTCLGLRFLRRYYGMVLGFDSGILLKILDDGRLVGFACGFRQPKLFYRHMWRRWYVLALPIACGVVSRPSLVLRVLRAVREVRGGSSHGFSLVGKNHYELSSLAVDPTVESRGVGRVLIGRFLDVAGADGATEVLATTDAVGNERVNRFYEDLGFRLHPGVAGVGERRLNHWIKQL